MRYPIYVPSKGRFERCLTAKFLLEDGAPFYLVVEEQEADDYASRYGAEHVLVLPFSNRGSVIPARNWIKQHATEQGHARHWQFDDNMRCIRRVYRGRRIRCKTIPALTACEDFVDRYTNVAVAGLTYEMFVSPSCQLPPFFQNVHVYSASLILNSIPHEWRGRYNEDTDLCLQVLADGWCTILFNAFMVSKLRTMVMGGGNTAELYSDDGRLRMARSLERVWPHVVSVQRRFQRPQHVVRDEWRKFDTPLQRRDDVDWEALEKQGANEFGMTLKRKGEVQSEALRKVVEDYEAKHGS